MPAWRALRAHVVLRSRFAEDRLAAAVHRGVTQYILFGAGFDTFALRQPVWALPLRILEVDHEGTQTMKRPLLAAADLVMPKNASLEAEARYFRQHPGELPVPKHTNIL
jgi:O-methyltransferase involved in polyketide biosynthesis